MNRESSNRSGQDCPAKMWQMWFLFRNFLGDCQACLPWMSVIASEIFFMIVSTPFLIVHKSNKKLGYNTHFPFLHCFLFDPWLPQYQILTIQTDEWTEIIHIGLSSKHLCTYGGIFLWFDVWTFACLRFGENIKFEN